MSITKILIRPYHCDSYGHVNHARYLEFFEEARWSAISSVETDNYLAGNSLSLVVVNINVDYKRPLFPGDLAAIKTILYEYGNSSFTVHQEMTNQENNICCKAVVKLVVIENASGRPHRILEKFKQLIEDVIQQKTQ